MYTSAKLLASLVVLTTWSGLCHGQGQCAYLAGRPTNTFQIVTVLVSFAKPAPVSLSLCLIKSGFPCLDTAPLLDPSVITRNEVVFMMFGYVCKTGLQGASKACAKLNLPRVQQTKVDPVYVQDFLRFGCESAKCSLTGTDWLCESGTRTTEVWDLCHMDMPKPPSVTTGAPTLADTDFILPPGYPNDWNAGEDDSSSVNPRVNLPSCAILIIIGIIGSLLPLFGS